MLRVASVLAIGLKYLLHVHVGDLSLPCARTHMFHTSKIRKGSLVQ